MTGMSSPTQVDGRTRRRRHLPIAITLTGTVLLFLVGLLTGYASHDGLSHLAADPETIDETTWTFGSILARNAGVALSLYTGTISLGLTTIITLPVLGLYIGATARIGIESVGWWAVAGSAGWYVGPEFLGCLIAAAGGLYPLVSASLPFDSEVPRWKRYLQAAPGSLLLLSLSVGLIILGAGIEILVIDS